jgi:ElaB/YqjD/DUF883 family membrane-anchored ribosome-binding protein
MHGSPVNRLEKAKVWRRTVAPDLLEPESSRRSAASRSWEHSLGTFIADHPQLVLATAAAVGLLLGWMVKRR